MVIDEAAIPSIFWEPQRPQAQPAGLAAELKQGGEVERGRPVQPRAGSECEDAVMGFSAKQVQALVRHQHL